jgi:phage baseplate assembly protein W
MTLNVATPWQIDSRGRTAGASAETHILQMIELVLFTNPGERVNRPDFGSGLQQLVFAPNSAELAATVQYTMQAALQRYLGDIIALNGLTVTSVDDELIVFVSYAIRATGQASSAQFSVSS